MNYASTGIKQPFQIPTIMKKTCFFAIISAMLLLGACVKTEIVPETVLAKLDLTPTNSNAVQMGNEITLSARYWDNQAQEQSESIQWLSRNPSVISVSPGGLVRGLALGQAWVVAFGPEASDSLLISVVENLSQAASVVILNPVTNLPVGDSVRLQAKVFDGNGQEMNGQLLSWQTSQPSVATISTDGWLRGLSPGTTQITATLIGGLSSPSSSVTVSLPNTVQSRSGTFTGNAGYMVNGTATLSQMGNQLNLAFGSDFQSSNGPMLAVYLAKNASGSLTASNSLKLANLISNTGAQMYTVPSGTALTDFNHVVIYCIPFNIRFGTASLN